MRQTRAEQAYSWDKETQTYLPVIDPECAEGTPLFLKGPIPWHWIIRASKLPGKALIVGLCLWRLKGATKKNAIPLSNVELEPFGVDRAAQSRALAALEQAGLISIERHRGRWSIITLVETSLVRRNWRNNSAREGTPGALGSGPS